MDAPLDEQYLTWLYSKVAPVKTRALARRYWRVLKLMYTKEFVWIIVGDDNRVEDGRDLRYRFLEERELHEVDPNWMGLGCSMLELLLGLAERLWFQADGEPDMWFWELMRNLGLDKYNDGAEFSDVEVEDILDRLIFRTYHKNGVGGLFPLRHSDVDQTEVELWYQLNAYILER